jgi:pyridoxine 4-dehydrogenase
MVGLSNAYSVVDHRLDGASRRNNGQPNILKTTDTTSIGSLTVPRVGIGTISWSSDTVTELENLDLQVLVNTACKSNAAFFDTAERYGGNWKTALGLGWGETEMMTGKFLQRSGPNKENSTPVVTTKFTPSPWRTTAESVVHACEQSRQRLGVDRIDLYQLHMPDIVQPLRFMGLGKSKDEVYWDGLAECYHRGIVENVGVCNYGPTLLMKCQEALARRGVPLASNQIAYSLIGRHNGAQETVDTCNELGIRVMAFFPFAMGLLTGKYTSGMSVVETSLTASRKTKLELKDLTKYAIGDGVDVPLGGIGPLLAVMERIAKTREKTIAQVALNYIICKGAIPIPGARNTAQLEDNIGAMGWRLTNTEVAMLELEADNLGIGFEGAGFKRTSEKFVGYGVEKWTLD